MKYKSEIYEALHEETLALFKVGAVSEAELREFEETCFVKESKPVYETEKPCKPSIREMAHITA